jgi:hypothetical protein
MLPRSDNERICRVGAGTPMGEVFRRYWLPVCVSTQIPKPDCDPLRVSLLGERLVIFRDTNGKVGVLDELCPHAMSLALGRVEECASLPTMAEIAVDGTILDTPNHRDEASSRVKARPIPCARRRPGLDCLGPAAKFRPSRATPSWMRRRASHLLRVNTKPTPPAARGRLRQLPCRHPA